MKTMEELAVFYHGRDTEQRIVGGKAIPYVEHPRAIVRRLQSWGCENTPEGHVLDIGWGHDLLEDTKIDPAEIVAVAGADTLASIEVLSNLPGKHADKAAYIAFVAQNATAPELLVKVADRLCNVEDFLVSEGREKAARYFAKAEPVFQAIWRCRKNVPADSELFAWMSRAIEDADRLGHAVGAQWKWTE